MFSLLFGDSGLRLSDRVGKYTVSTIKLHGASGRARYETLVFSEESGNKEIDGKRHASEPEARKYHARKVAEYSVK